MDLPGFCRHGSGNRVEKSALAMFVDVDATIVNLNGDLNMGAQRGGDLPDNWALC